jgi:hypothetical protein
MSGGVDDTATTVARVLARLGAGQTLRLRRSGPSGTVEVQARVDGAFEVPAAVLGGADGEEATGPHLLFGRHRAGELAGRLVAAIEDLELVTSSIVDGAGIERLLDGSGARTDVTVDGHLDRWDLPLIDQVRRYLSQRFTVPLSDLTSPWPDICSFSIGRVPHIVEVLHGPRRIRISAAVVQGITGSDRLDLVLHRLDTGDGLVRLRFHRDTVFAEVVLPAPTFMGQHLEAALDAMGSVDVLRATDAVVDEFGGESSFRKHHRPRLSEASFSDDPDDPDRPDRPTDLTDVIENPTETLNDDSEEEHP